jgi:hypothetical protein
MFYKLIPPTGNYNNKLLPIPRNIPDFCDFTSAARALSLSQIFYMFIEKRTNVLMLHCHCRNCPISVTLRISELANYLIMIFFLELAYLRQKKQSFRLQGKPVMTVAYVF